MTKQVVSKIAIHSTGPRRTGYGQFLHRINDAGRRLSLVKCRDDFGAIDEALQLWPELTTIGAFSEFDGFDGWNQDRFWNRVSKNQKIKVWEIFNEINGEWARQTDSYISIAPQFRERGLILGLFSCASGTPPYPSEDGGVAYREIARACLHMKAHGFTAVLCLHEYYAPGGGTIGRYKTLADYLESVGALLPIAISEFGSETYPGEAEFMRIAKAADQIYMADSRVIGAADWTLGGGGWGASNYERALPALGEYIATVEPPTSDPDPAIAFRGTCKLSLWPDVSLAAIAAGATVEKV